MQFIFCIWSFEISRKILRTFYKFICSRQDFAVRTAFGFVSVNCLTRNYSMLSLAFVAGSFGDTAENWLFEADLFGPHSLV